VPLETFLIILKDNLFFVKAINRAPIAPNEAASDGVAIPQTIDPTPVIINKIGGKNEEVKLISLSVFFVIF
jgi:hypothetical protein